MSTKLQPPCSDARNEIQTQPHRHPMQLLKEKKKKSYRKGQEGKNQSARGASHGSHSTFYKTSILNPPPGAYQTTELLSP